MQAILCVSTSISGVYGIKITAENRDSDLLSGYLGRSKDDISKPAQAVSISWKETRFAPFL